MFRGKKFFKYEKDKRVIMHLKKYLIKAYLEPGPVERLNCPVGLGEPPPAEQVHRGLWGAHATLQETNTNV